MPDLSIKVKKPSEYNNIAIVELTGYLDSNSSSDFEHVLNKLIFEGIYRIIVVLEGVDYISSAGWGIFVGIIKTIRDNGGDLKIVRMIPDVFETFKLLEFDEIFKVYDFVEDAIKDFGEKKDEG